ncbi:MAG: hypothetical protein NXH95_06930 [Pseudomonadaceae bacterium]|nr:hypothetical protein [Pseudomonadaceae bacterium]
MHKITRLLVFTTAFISHDSTSAAAPPTAYPSFADVVASKPIYSQETVYTPVKRCTWETLPSIERYSRHGYERRVTQRRAKRCRQENRPVIRKQVIGYEVTLRYQGSVFTRTTATKPGSRMPITVEITTLH